MHSCANAGWALIGYRNPQALQPATMFESSPAHQWLGEERMPLETESARTMKDISDAPYLPTETSFRQMAESEEEVGIEEVE